MKFFVIILCWTFVVAAHAAEKVAVSSKVRDEILSRAQVWHPVNIAEMNLREGPHDKTLHDNDTLNCTYIDMNKFPLGGTTPKFQCTDAAGRTYKIKYGQKNGEVYGSVVASRLLWALGFGADHVIPVKVNCLGCSKDPWSNKAPVLNHRELFKYAVVIVKPKGSVIYTGTDDREGVDWHELHKVKAELGGATLEQIDAFKLMASLIAHVDNKPDNQALVCQNTQYGESKECLKPLIYIHDLGTTFSVSNGHLGFSKFNLTKYSETPTWQDYGKCITGLKHGTRHTHMLSHPRISEGGRRFLGNLLAQLSHQQILDAFTATNVQNFNPNYTPEAWTRALEDKIKEITSHTGCEE